ncbi:MAG: ABC transporter ATP-binding protein [Ruminococcus sp.]|uniref:ABC transporter ATP-binding protein n=1 Tax=Ruminococcus flavefaciens TaxID=1265 RepID=UPI0026EAD2AC|nr:ABC transporter ATP-binding protein [Ruminococcus flavefaciens]MBQ6035313.1 ABC transporter ATP-binding protein [Ruminococcus sp.]
MNKVLQVKDLCKTYIIKKNSNNVLRNINFELGEGEFVTVMGPSGSGKSTLLYTVSGMDEMTSGKVNFNGRDISSLNKKEMSKLRLTEMGFIFQQMYMMKKLCVFDNIVLPAYQSGMSRSEANKRAESLMRRLDIIETAEHEVNEVSGGQLQRACLCRALINEPKVIFADEPTGALNSKAAADVMRELVAANRDGTSIMMVTHSIKVAAMSDKVLYLMDGDIQGEIELGKLTDETELSGRERRLGSWLMERGW